MAETAVIDRCPYCDDVLPEEPVALDIKVMDPDDSEWRGYYHRHLLCSEQCRRDARSDTDWMVGNLRHDPQIIHESEVGRDE